MTGTTRAHLHYVAGQRHQHDAMIALATGMARHGVHIDVCANWAAAERADLLVCWGDKVPEIHDKIPHLLLEAGYINGRSGDYVQDRLRFVSTGWNGLHGRADPGPSDCPPDRWQATGHRVRDWQMGVVGKCMLVCEQHPSDNCAPPAPEWAAALELAHEVANRVIYRPHPLMADKLRPLSAALKEAHTVLTWSSTAAVEAVLAGVPTIALDEGSIAWPVTSHDVRADEYLGDRHQWLYDLAYRQWTHDELKDGTAWDTLKENLH